MPGYRNVSVALSPADVANLLGVNPKTVRRWAVEGKLNSFKTPGGHLRFREQDVREFFEAQGVDYDAIK